jgi:hypothetical protein
MPAAPLELLRDEPSSSPPHPNAIITTAIRTARVPI